MVTIIGLGSAIRTVLAGENQAVTRFLAATVIPATPHQARSSAR